MTSRSRPWHLRARVFLAHSLTLPLHRFFNRFPHWELGLARAQVSKIQCRHPALAGRRAIHLSDLHLDRYRPRHDDVLNLVAGLKPDWIFVTGDLLNVADGLPHLFRFLAGLRSLAPVYFTLGNHDHHSGVSAHRFGELADRHKLQLLMNQVAFVPMQGGELAIVGVDDPSTHRDDLRCVPPRHPDRFTILLAHAASVLERLDERHALNLVLCGHSHGGQWRIPRVRPFWLPYGCNGVTEGHARRNGHQLYVNRGLGWSVLPIRWSCPPEIVLIEWEDETEEG
ncbi:MAG: metallophosphoesterase [Nitrospiraceae bacterium]